ncbi:hypothetical protein [Anaerotignum sp. MB30-C6]|uniref:hypothetical protein n=1 Tax=Anaerotignum sp. MB30-C6 TaxID=3070814 RepID=UPI0027DCBDCD|nr:hypothetical protein [Anaerotignum sp. MB30-C6]WMI81214.1 hypothetical protein RBQ60_00345 [Anaerotignum sp. MB30-C6]
MYLLSAGSKGASKIAEERPEILPWFLGFLTAMFLLNLMLGKIRSKKPNDRVKNAKK